MSVGACRVQKRALDQVKLNYIEQTIVSYLIRALELNLLTAEPFLQQ